MKKLIILFVAIFYMPLLYAQDLSDLMRYSQSEIEGTARYRALSGAFGALGGDMSAVSVNPAGSAVFSQSHASVSINTMDVTNDTDYFGSLSTRNDSNLSLKQGGVSFVFKNYNENSPWKKFTIGVAYDRTKSHDDDWYAAGTNINDDIYVDNNDVFLAPANSVASSFLLSAIGLRKNVFRPDEYELVDYFNIFTGDPDLYFDNYPRLYNTLAYQFLGEVEGTSIQEAFLGYQGYLFDPATDDDNNTRYTANTSPGNFTHNYTYLATGYNGKIAVNMAAQYGDNLYLGLNLNSHFIDYQRSTSLFETNSNGGLINEIDFRNTLTTLGRGFSFQLGSIIKLTKEFRLGLTYDSPTWYSIEEETTQYLDTSELIALDLDPIDPQAINLFPRTRIKTPANVTTSLAYVFGNRGLISLDYSFKDYSSAKFRSFSGLDDLIDNEFAVASTYRVGGEYKYEQFSFRGGYRFEESPYKNGVTVGDLNGYSLGIGYNFGNTRLDVTYDKSSRSFQTPLYNIGLTDAVSIDRTNSNVTLSLSFNI